MLENLGDRLQSAIKNIKGQGTISEENISSVVREIRLALLEADVNYKVVKEFTNTVKELALGEEVRKSLKPHELFVKIVNDELVKLLGSDNEPLVIDNKINTLMLVGLQGAGKTTHAGKLALHLRKKHKKKPLLVALDIYRKAAIDQLIQIGKELSIEVYEEGTNNPVEIAKNALAYAKENNFDYVIFDTAGRLHIDDVLMTELNDIYNEVNPNEVLLIVDSMMGQDAINIITTFNEKLKLTGTIPTKLDGDTKGGVILSIKHLTNLPIKFVGVSEKMDGLEAFYPDRIASRILGMGDVVSLVEKVQEEISEEDAMNTYKKLQKGKFDLDDFLKQLRQIKKLGPLENLIKMIPGASKMGLNNINIDKKQLAHVEAIISSMTPYERRNPDVIKHTRKQRISKGSGRDVAEINRLLNQFGEMKKMMKGGNFNFPGM